MNTESKAASKSKITSIFLPVELFIQRQTKKTFVIGALICMSATALSAIASPEGSHQTARNLISSSNQQTSNLPRDVQSLREQLIEKTRELQEYKASIFRASHPQDQAKITELNLRISELEKNKQELLDKINSHESELSRAKKQMNGLEVASDALTDYIQKQRALVEAEKKELLAKIQTYEEDTRLENERIHNEKLMIDLVVLMDTIANYDNKIAELEQNHNKELQDALQDAAMLKFELADTRLQADKIEHELLVSSLNYLTVAHDLGKSHKKVRREHESKLNLSEAELATLSIVIEDLKNENERIQKEHDSHVNLTAGGKEIMEKHFATRHVLANQLLEKDEALNAALIYYEHVMAEQAAQLQLLKENLAQAEQNIQELMLEKEDLVSRHSTEKQTLDEAIADGNVMIADAIKIHKQTINEHLKSLQELQSHLELENLHRHLLDNEKNELSADLKDHKQSSEYSRAENIELAVSIKEKEEQLKEALTASEESAIDYIRQIELLKEKLSQEEESRKALQTSHDELFAKHLNTNDYFESTLQDHHKAISAHENTKEALNQAMQEKENSLKTALSASEASANEYLEQIHLLKEKLAQEEQSRIELLDNHHELSASHQNSNETYAAELQKKDEAIASYEKDIEAITNELKEKEAELKIALMSSEDSSKEYVEEISSLKDNLAKEQEAINELKDAHEELSAKLQNSSENFERMLREKEDALKISLMTSEESSKEYVDQINDLKERLALEEESLKTLKKEHEELATINSLSLEHFERALQEKEEELKIALDTSDGSSKEYVEQINSLKEKLAKEEDFLNNLKKEHDELTASLDISNAHFERALQEKEDQITATTNSLKSSIAEHLKHIDDLKENLALSEKAHNQLKDAHEDLGQKLSQAETEKHALKNVIQETEASAHIQQAKHQSENLELQEQLASMQEHLEQQRELHTQYEAKHRKQYDDILSLEQNIQSLTATHHEAGQKNNNLEQQLSALSIQLEQKEREFEETSDQLRKLQQANNNLNDTLTNALSHIETTKHQLNATEQESAKAYLELHSHQLDSHQEISHLKDQISENNSTIDNLKSELAKLYANYSEKVGKEIELEQAIHSLTVVAEHQDHALAQASSAFSMVQEYNQHLEADYVQLKNRLNNLEIAERSGRNNNGNGGGSSKDEPSQSPIPSALFNLLKPNSK